LITRGGKPPHYKEREMPVVIEWTLNDGRIIRTEHCFNDDERAEYLAKAMTELTGVEHRVNYPTMPSVPE
jgi:hypothetical protein